MIPVLTNPALPAGFLSPRDASPRDLIDYDNGPIAITDTSKGLMVRKWMGRYEEGNIIYNAVGVSDQIVYTSPGITQISITFDQNGRPCFAYVDATGPHMYWFDPVAGSFVIYNLPAGAITPRVALDDKRDFNIPNSNIFLAYISADGSLCVRIQNERFLTEHVLAPTIGGTLRQIGMGNNNRFHFQVGH